ncbi:transketolase [Candidatus Woesebacteria bacterium RIFOXYC1_FULL_31_51]|uniref:Transketolase domain protein n=1 Tax=Candidatus Woesebacteria bacterium GW2011_GWC2_31_9 TaxID=1618586 RepID=A0A0F9YZA7_9BACT|nr:MAG: tktB protein [Candidatus Woesebacteria bacterium GW2011_GWF1_31_35]KKP23153.1 MAG: Transketolase domain protein [Candidatus Woesebacteria bacterium GW2011_GWC1_30_29]KKP26841.1 MAG: Transketolase domain protein [Candidatus Woesebacteria bacterium GW2011_GWD1_31_12]KKP27416.1 MAG: Transketolase domain protein [Candidatus Woesebacteria bacterium GW2011_GWB1_31_29]KKP31701.1 MAG: Transketolase domain protein [Candidatus Woesebacteria bacterium GW2011_GWC2_31_9]KKP33782.1 MAG: Transketolas
MKYTIEDLEKIAIEVREDIVKMILKAGAGHPAGSLGMVEVFVALYYAILNHDPKNPNWEDRDRLILSNGHICPARYAVMSHVGYFEHKELLKFGGFGRILQGHPDKRFLPSLETTSGPLGCGLAQGCGIAIGAKMDKKRFRTFVITSDGEHDEGNHWEAVAFAGKNNLSNLTLIVDRNNIQIDGFTENVMPLEPLASKYQAFGWSTIEIDGHNFSEIVNAANKARAIYENPTVIIAKTIPGKGVPFMEGNPNWHAKAPSSDEAKQAIIDIRTMQGKIKTYGE